MDFGSDGVDGMLLFEIFVLLKQIVEVLMVMRVVDVYIFHILRPLVSNGCLYFVFFGKQLV